MSSQLLAKKLPENGEHIVGSGHFSGVDLAMARAEASLKSLVMERRVDLGDHLSWMWLASIRKCPESDGGSANSANKTVSSAATMVMPVLMGGLG